MLLMSLFGLSYSDAISCTQSNSIASNIEVSLTPSNPTIGSNYVLDTIYTLSEDVYDGNAIYYVTLSGFPIVNVFKLVNVGVVVVPVTIVAPVAYRSKILVV